MSEEEKIEVGNDLEIDAEEEQTETPLKTPKKKFVMTPARLENLKKGREKRAANVRKKKEIETQIKEEEKSKKAEIKKRVEDELSRRDNARVSDTVEFAKQTPSLREDELSRRDTVEMQKKEEVSEPSDSDISDTPPPKPRKSVGREVKPQARRTSQAQGRVDDSSRVSRSPQHVVVFI